MGKEKMTFEDAMGRIEQIVTGIEQGQVSLEQSIEKFEEGMRLVKQCRQILDASEKRIQMLTRGEDSSLQAAGDMQEPQ